MYIYQLHRLYISKPWSVYICCCIDGETFFLCVYDLEVEKSFGKIYRFESFPRNNATVKTAKQRKILEICSLFLLSIIFFTKNSHSDQGIQLQCINWCWCLWRNTISSNIKYISHWAGKYIYIYTHIYI